LLHASHAQQHGNERAITKYNH